MEPPQVLDRPIATGSGEHSMRIFEYVLAGLALASALLLGLVR